MADSIIASVNPTIYVDNAKCVAAEISNGRLSRRDWGDIYCLPDLKKYFGSRKTVVDYFFNEASGREPLNPESEYYIDNESPIQDWTYVADYTNHLYYNGNNDDGGVHHNSTVISHVIYAMYENGLNNNITPNNVLNIDINIVTFHNLLLFALSSNAYCNFVALLIIIAIPKINGITLAMACGFIIIKIPSIVVTIPYTISSSLFPSLLVP